MKQLKKLNALPFSIGFFESMQDWLALPRLHLAPAGQKTEPQRKGGQFASLSCQLSGLKNSVWKKAEAFVLHEGNRLSSLVSLQVNLSWVSSRKRLEKFSEKNAWVDNYGRA